MQDCGIGPVDQLRHFRSDENRSVLRGTDASDAIAWAAGIVETAAQLMGASSLIEIDSTHLVGTYYSGVSDLEFLHWLGSTNVKVAVKTTLNASSADLTASTSNAGLSDRHQAREVVDALIKIGATPTLTCAPYYLDAAPKFGARIAWAESNAVIFANSVIGARTLKTPQYLDLACAISGKAPLAGVMQDEGRKPEIIINATDLPERWFSDGIGYELLGFRIGEIAGERIPYFTGVPAGDETKLRALCAALGVCGSMAMAHIENVTPEWRAAREFLDTNAIDLPNHLVERGELIDARARLGTSACRDLGTIALGAPHASPRQIDMLAQEVRRRGDNFKTRVVVSLGRDVYQERHKDIELLAEAGAEFVRDTCTYYGSIVRPEDGAVLTGSAKWAFYGGNGLNCETILGSWQECIEACFTGRYLRIEEFWNA